MDSITQGISHFQIALLVELGLVVWAVFSKGQMREYVISFVCFGVLAGLYFYPRVEAATDFEQILGIVAFSVGLFFLHNAGIYHERVIEGYDQAIDEADREYQFTVAQNNLRELRQRTHYLPEKTNREIERDGIRLDTEVIVARGDQEATLLTQEQQRLREGLLEEARERKLRIDDILEANRERALGQVKTEQKYEETIAVIGAGEILETKDVQLIKKLTEEMLEQARLRQKVIDDDGIAPSVKELAIAQYTANIEYLKRQINERQGNGLVLPQNRQETLGTGEGTADVRGFKEPGDERPPEQVPASRRRGRPAGSGSAKRGGKGKSSSHTGDDGGGQK